MDDLTGLWTRSEKDFSIWSNNVNSNLNRLGLSIKDNSLEPWDFNKPGQFTTFLDIRYTFNESGELFTGINIKSTDARVYLHFCSHHPRQTFPSMIIH